MDNKVLKYLRHIEDDEFRQKIEEFKNLIKEVHNQVSKLRKEGKNTEIVDIKLLNVQPKLKMLMTTRSKSDQEIFQNLIKDIQTEIDYVAKENHFQNTLDIMHRITNEYNRENHKDLLDLANKLEESMMMTDDEIKHLLLPSKDHVIKRVYAKALGTSYDEDD
jgi:hypothetical protein